MNKFTERTGEDKIYLGDGNTDDTACPAKSGKLDGLKGFVSAKQENPQKTGRITTKLFTGVNLTGFKKNLCQSV